MTFADRLKQIRQERNELQRESAEKIGITKEQFSDYECGKHEPGIYIAVKIADYFGVTTDYLLGRTDKK